MKTVHFNPSKLEMEFSEALHGMINEVEKRVSSKILSARHESNDNPALHLKLEDEDGDQHEMVIKFIQRYED